MSANITLGIFTIAIMILTIGVHPFTRKATNTYWFWLAYGIFTLTLIIVYRWGLDIRDLANYLNKGTLSPIGADEGLMWSKALLLDMCPATAVAISIAIVVDPTRKGARAIAPMAIFGGMITVFGQIMLGNDGAEWSYEYLFVGFGANRAYFLIHFFNIITGILVLLNTPRFTLNTYCGEYLLNAFYFLYVAIVVYAFDGVIYCNVTGILIYDWTSIGEYSVVADTLNCSPEVAMVVGYAACILAVNAIIGLNVAFQRCFEPYKVKNKHSKKWYKGLNGWYELKPYSKNKHLKNV